MPIFEKKEGPAEKPKTREILDIIFDMLSADVPEENIISMLKQMGLGDEEAQKTLSTAKLKYEALVQSSLSAAVDKLLAKERGELMNRVDAKVDSMRKELLLKADMTAPEAQKYVDNRFSEVDAEISTIKSDLFSSKSDFNSRLRTVEEKTGETEKKTSKVLASILVIIAGIFILFFAANQIRDLLSNFQTSSLSDIIVYLIVILIGLVVIVIGIKYYPKEQSQEFRPTGTEYVK
jgi:uncharacterized membrane protein YuzA (DUF378 family)